MFTESNPLKLNRLNAKMNSPVKCNAVENALGFVRKKNAFGKLCTVGVFSPRKAITASTCVNGLDNYHLEVVVMFTNPGSSVYNVTAVYYENPIVILFVSIFTLSRVFKAMEDLYDPYLTDTFFLSFELSKTIN